MEDNRPIIYSTYFKRWYIVLNDEYIDSNKIMNAEHIDYEVIHEPSLTVRVLSFIKSIFK